MISTVVCRLPPHRCSAGAGDNQRCQALLYGRRGRQPDVGGHTEVHGPHHLPQPAVVRPSSDYGGAIFPVAGT